MSEIHQIINAIMTESESSEEFKRMALSDVEKAIQQIIDRDFPLEFRLKYEQSKKRG